MTTHYNETADQDPVLPVMPDDGGKGPERARVQNFLGFTPEPVADYDAFAMQALARLDGAMAGVNRMDAQLNQYFVGFAVRDSAGDPVQGPDELRAFGGCGDGYCNYIAAERTLPLPLNDVFDFPRFANNPVTEVGEGKPGVRAYIGAPLLSPEGLVEVPPTTFTPRAELAVVPAGITFGTLWVVDTVARIGDRAWKRHDVGWIKGQANTLRDEVVARAVAAGLVSWSS